jgi:hypothetical protein
MKRRLPSGRRFSCGEKRAPTKSPIKEPAKRSKGWGNKLKQMKTRERGRKNLDRWSRMKKQTKGKEAERENGEKTVK